MKKLNKFFAILVSLAMMATLCVCMAFAQGEGKANNSYITKYVKLPSGVTIPDETFEFEVTPQNGAPAVKNDADLDLNTLKAGDFRASESEADGSSLVGNLKIADWFDATSFPAAGKYTYTVKEKAPEGYEKSIGDNANEKLVYSQAQYTIEIYVTNDGTGKKIEDIIAKDEQGKVDVTDTDPTDNHTQDDVTDANAEGATFVNDFQNLGNTPDDPGEVDPTKDDFGDLGIKKVVTGTYGDKTAPFKFNVTVNKPANYPVDTVEAYIYTGSTKADRPTTFTFDQETPIELSHDQTLAFINLPEGTTYAVTENLAGTTAVTPADYKASYETINKDAEGQDTAIVTAEAVEATGAGANLELAAANKKAIANTDQKNTVVYTNDSQVDDTPTGILINNLPYIALALVAIGGLVAYVVVRRRQNDEA